MRGAGHVTKKQNLSRSIEENAVTTITTMATIAMGRGVTMATAQARRKLVNSDTFTCRAPKADERSTVRRGPAAPPTHGAAPGCHLPGRVPQKQSHADRSRRRENAP